MIDLLYAKALASLILDAGEDEKITGLRYNALLKLYKTAGKYQEEGFLPEMVEAFFDRKSQMLLNAKSKTEINEILKPSAPYYDGNAMVPKKSPYYVEEEELMLWSRTSLLGPLNDAGNRRYKELFQKLLPEQAAQIWKEAC